MLDDLATALRHVRPVVTRIATAYLTPDGFRALEGGLEASQSVKLLLGERPFLTQLGPHDVLASGSDDLFGPRETIGWVEFLGGEVPWILMTHEERKAALLAGRDYESMKAFNLASWEKVRQLVTFLERPGVEVARYLGDKAGQAEQGKVLDRETAPHVHLHAKAYLFKGEHEAYAAVGSSNLTKGGLSDNVELNATTTDQETIGQLEAWFDRKWEEGQDCNAEFIHLLEQCVLFGRRFTPWQVFLKALHTAYGRFLGFGLGEELREQLAQFQQEAVARCVQLLNQHWGCMLCDSVGLGKTHEGLAILQEYLNQQDVKGKALVVCPAQLEHNWSEDKLRLWGIPGETVTMESLPQLADLNAVEDLVERESYARRLRRLQQYDVVLVDESHNFRNPGTKRYRGLMSVIRGGEKADKRVLLMTATPVNNSLWDLYHQLMLITRGDNNWYSGRGPVGNLEGTFRQLEKAGGGIGLLDTMLLTLVRRTRHDIRERQEAGEPLEIAGKPMRFPDHEIPEALTYSLEALYPGIYGQVIDTINGLSFAVYNLELFGIEAELSDEAKKEREATLKRNESFIGIIKTTYLKRMESSVAALLATIDNHVRYQGLFLQTLHQGRVLRPKDAQRLKVMLGGSLSDDALTDVSEGDHLADFFAELPTVPAEGYKHDELETAVKADVEGLAELATVLKRVSEKLGAEGEHDPKMSVLRDLLQSLPKCDEHGEPSKVVIFTNYRDTAYHIFKSLGGSEAVAGGKGLRCPSNLPDARSMSVLTGSDDRKRRQEVLYRFAPLASFREDEEIDDPVLLEKIEPLRAERVDLLVSTDVLSEGQNLQDAQYLVNYDLHWNPVRMIQRAGRIDRLFSPHEKVFVYNMMPEKELEDLLKIVKRVKTRLGGIEATVGLDASVLGEVIEEKAFDDLMKIRQGGDEADRVYREGERRQGFDDALDEIKDYINLVRDLGTEEVLAIPDGVYSIKEGSPPGVFIMLRMPDDLGGQVFWRFYEHDAATAKSAAEVAQHISCGRAAERVSLPEDANPFKFLKDPLERAVSELGQEYKQRIASQEPSELVRIVRRHMQSDDVLEAIPELTERFAKWCAEPHPDDLLRRDDAVQEAYRGLKVAAATDDVVRLLKELWEALEAKGLDRGLPRPGSQEPSERDLQLVCWELVVDKKTLAVMQSEQTTGVDVAQP